MSSIHASITPTYNERARLEQVRREQHRNKQSQVRQGEPEDSPEVLIPQQQQLERAAAQQRRHEQEVQMRAHQNRHAQPSGHRSIAETKTIGDSSGDIALLDLAVVIRDSETVVNIVVKPSDTVRELKRAIAAKTHVSSKHQRISFKDHTIAGPETLAELGVKTGDTMLLVVDSLSRRGSAVESDNSQIKLPPIHPHSARARADAGDFSRPGKPIGRNREREIPCRVCDHVMDIPPGLRLKPTMKCTRCHSHNEVPLHLQAKAAVHI